MLKREPKLYLEDIRSSIRKIIKYIDKLSFSKFSKDEKTVDAVIRNLEIIGEAANNIPKEVIKKYPEIPWQEIIGMRNKAIHEYFGVDLTILRETIKNDLPELNSKIKKIF